MSVGTRPGAGVRLGDQPLLLERGHVVAHRGRRDAEPVPLDERLGADRLLGGDVVLDDGAEHGEPAFVLHRHLLVVGSAPLGPGALALTTRECQRLLGSRSVTGFTRGRRPGLGRPPGVVRPERRRLVGGADGLLVVDTHASGRAAARDRRRRARLCGIGPVTAVVNTHEHFDHTFGNARLPRGLRRACPIHAHEEAAARTVDAGERIKRAVRRRARTTRAATRCWRPRSCPPTTPSPRCASLDLGDRQVELVHPGRGHTDGDVVRAGRATPTCCWPATWSRRARHRRTASTATRSTGRGALDVVLSLVGPRHRRRARARRARRPRLRRGAARRDRDRRPDDPRPGRVAAYRRSARSRRASGRSRARAWPTPSRSGTPRCRRAAAALPLA